MPGTALPVTLARQFLFFRCGGNLCAVSALYAVVGYGDHAELKTPFSYFIFIISH